MQQACLVRGVVARGKVLGVLCRTSHCRVVMVVGALTNVASGVAVMGVFLLAIVAPFEATRPLVQLPGQALSNLEAALLLSLVVGGVALWRSDGWRPWDVPLAPTWTALVGAMGVAALAAPAARANAWHMTGRMVAAAAVYALTVASVTSRARLRTALALCVGSGVVVAALAVLEYFQVDRVLQLLRLFRPGVTAVGSQVRAGGPLQYPTIASMYLEVVFAFGLGLMLSAVDESDWRRAIGWFAALATIGQAITLTFTRAGLIVMAASALLVGAQRVRRIGVERGGWLLVALAGVVTTLFMLSRSPQSVWLRMTSESQDAWYRASVRAPSDRSFAVDRPDYVDVDVTNTGRVAWDSHGVSPIYFSYHWLDAAGERVVAYEGSRTAFAGPIAPGATATLHALVRAPRQPGAYRLEWDLVQEHRLWFSTEASAPDSTFTRATVSGTGIGGPLTMTARPPRAVRPGRLVLWRAAGHMVAAHPLLGVGPDNFRLLYGPYAGLAGADPRTHSNNMYLEVLVGGGLLAAVAFAWFLYGAYALFASSGDRIGLRAGAGRTPIAMGIAAAGFAIALHAMVDSFLSFAPTYVLFSLTLGFAAAVSRGVELVPDAHRA
jgi:O-antigen ligase